MADPLSRLRRFLSELKRRNVYRVAVTYAVVGFVLIEAADLIFPALNIPSWAYSLVVVLVLFGLPVALVLAWAFEMTPEGVRRTPSAEPRGEGPEPAAERRSRSRLAVKALVGLGLVAAAAAAGWYLTGGGGESPEVGDRTVAVLPFQVSGAADETWRDGMVTYLSPGLDGAGGLRAIPDRTIFAAAGDDAGTVEGVSAEEALGIARQVGARYAVIGSAGGLGEEVRFAVEVYETESGERLGQVEVRGSPDSVPALADRLTRRLLGVLMEEGGQAIPSVDLTRITTRSVSALKTYLEGERHFRAGEYPEAIADFEDAVREDSSFALAYARLARSHGWMEQIDEAARHSRRAYELSDRLPERERRLLYADYLWRVEARPGAAADSLRSLTEAYPDDPSVWYRLGETLFHGFAPGGWAVAETAFERAVELDPGIAPYHHHLVEMAFWLHHDSALAARRVAAHPDGWRKRLYGLALHLVFGDEAERQEALARIDTLSAPAGEGNLTQLRVVLAHPRDAQLRERVLRRIRHREDVSGDPFQVYFLPPSLQQGKIRGYDPSGVRTFTPGWPSDPGCHLASLMSLGVPVPDTLVRPLLEPALTGDHPSLGQLQCAQLYLAKRGRTGELQELADRFEKRVAAARDSQEIQMFGALTDRGLADMEGFRAWKRGDLERAAEVWSASWPASFLGALWRGEVHRELGDLQEAEDWYLAAWIHPLTQERLGRLYEEMDEPEKAADAYRRFVAAWEDADPELQDRVEAVRERLQKLTAGEAESDR